MNFESGGSGAFEHTSHYRVVCALLLLWLLASFYPTIRSTDTVSGLKTASDAAAQGSIYFQVVIVGFAALGVAHLPEARRRLDTPQAKRLIFLLGCYLCWCALSILWSADPFVSTRRLISLVLIVAGSTGLGAGFYGCMPNGIAALARHVMYAASLCVMFLLIRIASGGQDITDPQWNLKYTAVIEPYAFLLGYGVVAVIYLFRDQPFKRLAVGLVYFLMLLVLKGRTLILGVFSAGGIIYSKLSPGGTLRILVMTVSCAVAALLLDLTTGGQVLIQFALAEADSISDLLPYISIGAGIRNITMLSGRLPLWQALLPHAAASPLIGHGFGAFWTADRFAEIYAVIRWHAVVAHNGFLDEILATGTVGLVLLLAFWGYGMYLSWRLGSSGYVVFAWSALFLYFNTMASIIENYNEYPTFVSFAALAFVASRYSLQRCEDCGAELLEERNYSGETVLVHP